MGRVNEPSIRIIFLSKYTLKHRWTLSYKANRQRKNLLTLTYLSNSGSDEVMFYNNWHQNFEGSRVSGDDFPVHLFHGEGSLGRLGELDVRDPLQKSRF